jgi:hypothetical protein
MSPEVHFDVILGQPNSWPILSTSGLVIVVPDLVWQGQLYACPDWAVHRAAGPLLGPFMRPSRLASTLQSVFGPASPPSEAFLANAYAALSFNGGHLIMHECALLTQQRSSHLDPVLAQHRPFGQLGHAKPSSFCESAPATLTRSQPNAMHAFRFFFARKRCMPPCAGSSSTWSSGGGTGTAGWARCRALRCRWRSSMAPRTPSQAATRLKGAHGTCMPSCSPHHFGLAAQSGQQGALQQGALRARVWSLRPGKACVHSAPNPLVAHAGFGRQCRARV